jgi:DNA-binding transcriptional LysR family regulator
VNDVKATPAQLRAVLHVLRHRGYANAERATGIARPTLHEGVKGAEAAYGCQFFEASPFRILPCGRLLQPVLERFVREMEQVEEQLVRAGGRRLGIIADELVATHYLPGLIRDLEDRHPGLSVETASGDHEAMRALLSAGAMDCALAADSAQWKGFSRAAIVELPLAVLAPRSAGITSAAELWPRSPVPFRLAVPRVAPRLLENFAAGLKGLRVQWPNRREVSSLHAVEQSVAQAGDFGLSIVHPRLASDPARHVLPLPHFPPLAICLFWRGKPRAEITTLLALLRATTESAAATAGDSVGCVRRVEESLPVKARKPRPSAVKAG